MRASALKMVGARAFRRQQQKHQIDGLAIHRFEIDRALEPREQSKQFSSLGNFAVRNGDAIADGGRSEFLRCNSTSKIARSFCRSQRGGTRRRAPAEPGFLPLTFNAGRIASGGPDQ